MLLSLQHDADRLAGLVRDLGFHVVPLDWTEPIEAELYFRAGTLNQVRTRAGYPTVKSTTYLVLQLYSTEGRPSCLRALETIRPVVEDQLLPSGTQTGILSVNFLGRDPANTTLTRVDALLPLVNTI